MDGEYYHDKAATLPRGKMKAKKDVGVPIVENYHTYSYEISILLLISKTCKDILLIFIFIHALITMNKILTRKEPRTKMIKDHCRRMNQK